MNFTKLVTNTKSQNQEYQRITKRINVPLFLHIYLVISCENSLERKQRKKAHMKKGTIEKIKPKFSCKITQIEAIEEIYLKC
jgi:hypothetical protein